MGAGLSVVTKLGFGLSLAVVTWKSILKITVQPKLLLPTKWEEVGEVSEMFIHPIKSAYGISVTEADAKAHGMNWLGMQDRSFLVISKEGRFITGRQSSKLITLRPRLDDHILTIQAADSKSIQVDLNKVKKFGETLQSRVWNQQVCGLDCGPEVAKWLSQQLYGKDNAVRLIYKGHNTFEDRPPRPFTVFPFPHQRPTDKMYYQDDSSYMLCSESSLKELNSRMDQGISMRNMRPNIVVSGSAAFDEDDWHYVKIGDDVILRRVKPCERCLQTTISPTTGERHPEQEPLATLRTFRCLSSPAQLAKVWKNRPIFGSHMGIDRQGKLKVGMKVYVARASSSATWQYNNEPLIFEDQNLDKKLKNEELKPEE